jgi:sulfur-oxidizing protein SoxY
MTALVGLMASAGLMTEAQAATWNKAAFEAKTLDDVMRVLGDGAPQKSAAVILRAPDIAENGAAVPVGVETNLNATEMAILIEKNPSPMAALFTISKGAEAFTSTRVKMNQTSNVYALAKVDGKWLMASKEVKVTLGACGA